MHKLCQMYWKLSRPLTDQSKTSSVCGIYATWGPFHKNMQYTLYTYIRSTSESINT